MLILIEQALQAGVESVVLVVNPHDAQEYREFFNTQLPPTLFHALTPAAQSYAKRIIDLGRQVGVGGPGACRRDCLIDCDHRM